ncbi:IS110 family transposase [Listeria ivanovii]|uniref:IS110 family transposase n=1 Tax=Listeria ivanovii TaxID=1638 RepID=UPI000DA91A0A|nr:IS110 family transposase [Listeria ivanovii]PZG31054.1 IS110 family transposase [Listeria ivanovii]PZG44754.1 IS110 family transposase [Listeria ivanovii]PZH08288.1 IS110 family transposase [Listeria ivanovii]
MFYVGIDIAKTKHFGTIIDEKGNRLTKPFPVLNTSEGGAFLINKLASISSDKSQFRIGMEATGHYWIALYSFLEENGYHHISVLNPLQTNAWRKGTDIRKRKTDSIDSLLIADFIRFHQTSTSPFAQEVLFNLRQLTRFRHVLTTNIGDVKRRIVVLLDQVFPEYESLFSNTFGKASMALLNIFISPQDLAKLSLAELTHIITQASHGRLGKEKAQELKDLASGSFGIKFGLESFQLQLKLLLEQLKLLIQQRDGCDKEIASIMVEIDSPITTIPGIGPILGAIILSELGSIERFSKASKIVAYAGIDASISQSGNSFSDAMKLSKRGSSHLRRAIFQAAMAACRSAPLFQRYYDKKKKQGKHYYVCIGASSRKMCHIIYAVLKNNTAYIEK